MKTKLAERFLGVALAAVIVSGISSVYVRPVMAAELSGKITVSGEGAITADPDIAYLNLGISTMEAEAKAAQQKNDAQMNSLIAALKEMGIEDKDLKTNNYSIYPERDYNNGNKIIGYVVNNNLSVTIRNLELVGDVLDKCISEGANTGSGIEFSIEDSSKYYEQALTLAIQNAGDKSRVMAQALGVTIGGPVEVIESSRMSVMPIYSGAMSPARAEAAATDSNSVPIESGSLVIRANVEASYSY